MNDTTNHPYDLNELPAVLNFSGGRSSGYMLHQTLEHYGGQLPEGVKVIFTNTGKERPETLDFVRDCAVEWDAPIIWLEYRYRSDAAGGRKEPKHHFAVVDYKTASRNGEPFDQLIRAKGMLPNPVMRFCTQELKVKTAERFLRRVHGWKKFTGYLGIRYDEPRRIKKTLMEACKVDYPLYHARIGQREINDFWAKHSFDLAIESREGNCDLCFLKGRKKLTQLIHEGPQRAAWWVEKENTLLKKSGDGKTEATFRKGLRYADMLKESKNMPLQLPFGDDEGLDCFCGD